MNWTIENNQKDGYIRVNLNGTFNLEDHGRKMDEIVSQPYWKPDTNIFFDCTRLDFDKMDLSAILKLGENFIEDDRLIGCGKIALLMKSSTDFGRGRQFELLTSEKICADIKIFLDEKQALRWLES